MRLVRITSEDAADELAAELHDEFPWLAPATETVWHAMRRSVREGWPGLRLPPMLLDGPPGIGKSVWARRLAELIHAPSEIVEATGETASFGIVGNQRGWSNAAPGRPLEAILLTRIGNPVVIVDEVEKAGSALSSSGRAFDLAASLLPLLEPATARTWTCPYFRVRFDMSWVGWILTANTCRTLPDPLLSRCPAIHLRALSPDDLAGFALRECRRRHLSQASDEAIIEALQHLSFRSERLNLRTVIRMLDRAEQLEADPRKPKLAVVYALAKTVFHRSPREIAEQAEFPSITTIRTRARAISGVFECYRTWRKAARDQLEGSRLH